MVGVGFHYHRGFSQTQWSYLRSAFACQMWQVGGAEVENGVTGVESAADIVWDGDIVVCQPENARYLQGTEPLTDFVHPSDCLYIFGSDRENTTEELLGFTPATTLYIPMASQYELHSPLAASIVLWDRYSKAGGGFG